ncbi:hypothetical protein JOC94_000351 [Bacillus thermophilus]|uniref:Uncharacterized protein n=1 Tax=Siminovitchia thermophila TaxID=1245522 RepID=A0ABS2R3B9_9BACI|nr:hypothetical protein [Siminovitchia thermophila]
MKGKRKKLRRDSLLAEHLLADEQINIHCGHC